MRIFLIGSGNVATVLGRLFMKEGHIIEGVYSKNPLNATKLAEELNAKAESDITKLTKDADLYLIAVSDTAIPAVAATFNAGEKLVVHTSGAVPKHVLNSVSKNYGIFYPVQSLRKEMLILPEIPILIDGNSPVTREELTRFATSISSQVKTAGDDERLRIHTAAVIVSNFTNFLYSITKEYLESTAIDFSVLTPLIAEVAERTGEYDPRKMQTGPAIRGDETTIQKHLEILKDQKQLYEVYKFLTEELKKFYNR